MKERANLVHWKRCCRMLLIVRALIQAGADEAARQSFSMVGTICREFFLDRLTAEEVEERHQLFLSVFKNFGPQDPEEFKKAFNTALKSTFYSNLKSASAFIRSMCDGLGIAATDKLRDDYPNLYSALTEPMDVSLDV